MQSTPTNVRWQIIAILFVIYVLMFIDRVNISIAAKFIMAEYDLSDVEFGWIFSAFVLGYALAQIPGGWLGDRYGPRRVLTAAILWWSAFTVLTAVAGDMAFASVTGVVGSFVIVRALTGIGEAAGPPNGNRMIANWVPARERALALGVAISGSPLGAALTPPLIVWIMTTWGWREAFYVSGAAGLVVALLFYRLTRDTPGEHPRVNAAERDLVAPDAPAPLTSARSLAVPWRRILASRDLWFLTAAYVVLGYTVYFYFAWFFLYLVDERGFSLARGGLYTMAPFLASAVAGPIGGWLSDRLCVRYGKRVGRCGLSFVSMSVTGVLFLIGAVTEDAVLAVVVLSASIGSLYLSLSSFWAVTIDLSQRYAGTVSGFMNMGGNLGGTVSPTLTPYLAQQFGWSTALSVIGVLCLLGALCWLGVHPDRAIADDSA